MYRYIFVGKFSKNRWTVWTLWTLFLFSLLMTWAYPSIRRIVWMLFRYMCFFVFNMYCYQRGVFVFQLLHKGKNVVTLLVIIHISFTAIGGN